MSTDEISFKDLGLKFFFVVKDGLDEIENVSTDMSVAYANIREYVDENVCIVWMQEAEVVKLAKDKLTKTNIFVLDSFDGQAFSYLLETKALILGPRCILSSLMENSLVPLGTSPVFTTAMRNQIICASGLPTAEKRKIQELVQWMGGYYCEDLNASCTHLVANTIKSNKYEMAGLNDIPIMHSDWVHDVWARSKKENISGTSKKFYKHKLPIFYSLHITTTGLPNDKKNELTKLITENGGRLMGSFKSSQTDVLLVEKDKIDSDKYRAAVRYKKDCLLPEWIYASITKGYALPTKDYKVVNLKVSTPTRLGQSTRAPDFNPDCTQLSEISRIESVRSNSTVNETISSNTSTSSFKPQRKAYKDCLAQISTQMAKKSGPFLDGCCIYLAGFTSDEKEKLNKILNVGGAIRYDEINDKITHCIVGEPTLNELNKLNEQCIHMLKLEWLAESIKHKLPAMEEPFVYRTKIINEKLPEPPSPSSKKTIESMNHSFKKPALPRTRLDFGKPSTSKANDENGVNPFENEQNEFLSQYTPENAVALPPKSTSEPQAQPVPTASMSGESDGFDTDMCTEDYENLNFFIGFSVYVHDHEEELFQQLVSDCENAGAKLVDKTYSGLADYVIVPSEEATDIELITVKGKHVVNNLWIEDAMKQNKIVDVEYFHQPIPIAADAKPLANLIIVISVYSGTERIYIESLAKILGATKFDTYAKKQRPLLICRAPDGAKYNAAIKWNYPVVKSDWLVECAIQGEMVQFGSYLIGKSVSSSWNMSKSSTSDNSDPGAAELNSKEPLLPKDSTRAQNEKELEDNVFLPPMRSPTKENRKSHQEANELRYLEDITKNDNAVKTPDGTTFLRHRRLSELANPNRRNSKESPTTPTTPQSDGESTISEIIRKTATPNREYLYNILKEIQSKATPESERIRRLVATPGSNLDSPQIPKMPDFVTTPEILKRRLAYADSFYVPSKVRRPSTPFSEIHKRFWKEALGDQYFEDGNYNTQTFTQVKDDAIPSTSAEHANTESDQAATKRLSDFLKNRDQEKQNDNEQNPPETETEGMPESYDSEMMGGAEKMVGWRDPSEFSSKARTKVDGMRFSGTPRFSISCANDVQKQQIIAKIIELKGEVCKNMISFDETCSHIVCERPNRGEKILSCLASGKWILGLKYIEDSLEAGYFLDEELYEWGNPKASNLTDLSTNEQSIANAAFRWRTKIGNRTDGSVGGVFEGFRVILHVTMKEQFQKLILAGSGIVLNVSEPYGGSKEALQATHCFVEQKKKKLNPVDHKALSNAGVKVLWINYLNAHLTSEVQPDYAKYLLSL